VHGTHVGRLPGAVNVHVVAQQLSVLFLTLLAVMPANPVQGMLVWNPFRRAPGSTNLLLESLVKASASLDGNSCPFNATNPLDGCPAGHFCPTAGQMLPCPAGHFCPVGVRMDSPSQGGLGGVA
jgi:hypothetical protein